MFNLMYLNADYIFQSRVSYLSSCCAAKKYIAFTSELSHKIRNEKKYSISSYDKNVCLKLNGLMWLIILFFLKAYVIAFATVTNSLFSISSSDTMPLITMFYPDKGSIFLGMIAGVPVMLLIFAWIKKKPDLPSVIRFIWTKGRHLMAISAALNACIIFSPQLLGAVSKIMTSAWVLLLINALIVIVVYNSSYMKDCFSDFPGN